MKNTLNRVIKKLHLDDLPYFDSKKAPWTLVELGELIRRIGIVYGFEVIPEYPLETDGTSVWLKTDWIWRSQKTPKAILACFEIEGTNAPHLSIENDLKRLSILRPKEAFVVSYGCRYKKHSWTNLPNKETEIARWLKSSKQSVRLIVSTPVTPY